MQQFISSLENRVLETISEPSDYEKDGFIYCGKCHTKKQVEVMNPFTNKLEKKPCICSCMKQEIEKEEQQRKEAEERHKKEKLLSRSFSEPAYRNFTFEKDDLKNPKETHILKRYADRFREIKQSGQGLLLYGNIGTGKTFLSACVANQLIDEGFRVHMTTLPRIIAKIQKETFEKSDTIADLTECDLLIIDDLGVERQTEYMQEQVFEIIDARYRAKKPMLVSTNLSAKEMNSPAGIMAERIYDRILERCYPVCFEGENRRRDSNRFNELRGMLNG